MTLCVAAECKRHKRFFNAIVFASDFAVETDTASAQIGRKLVCGGSESYPILMAGTQTRALALASEVLGFAESQHQPPDKESRPVNWEPVLTDAVRSGKYRIADEITSGRFGIPYSTFLEKGKASLPDDIFRDTLDEIGKSSLDCSLLVLGFSHTYARIYRLSPSGLAETCENFAAIGSGYYIAESSLFQRSQSVANDLGTTIYNVYEAMKLGSIAPGVGDKFQIGVAEWDWYEQPNPHNRGEVKISFLEPAYYDFLQKQFLKFGPKPLSSVKIKPRLIKEQERALVTTPKGEQDEGVIKARSRSKAARDREARKRDAKRSVSQKLEPEL